MGEVPPTVGDGGKMTVYGRGHRDSFSQSPGVHCTYVKTTLIDRAAYRFSNYTLLKIVQVKWQCISEIPPTMRNSGKVAIAGDTETPSASLHVCMIT